MANLADKSGDAYSNLVHGDGSNALAFTMPGSVPLAVESVVATIDNAAGGDTTPTLVVRDSSGEVIATKRQDDVIPAGDTGTATFSLRNSGKATLSGAIRYVFPNSGEWLSIHTTGRGGPDGVGIGLVSEGAWGITIECDGGPVVLRGDEVQILDTASGGADVTPDGPLGLKSFSSGVTIQAGENVFVIPALDLVVFLQTGQVLEVQDAGSNPIFRVNEDGSLQGKTGKALTFNL